ncbi:MAG: GNAT family N-acetyltransferase [Fimbriimonas sp.]
MLSIAVASEHQLDEIRAMLDEYEAELAVDLCFQKFEEERASLPGRYAPPSGALLVALDGEEVVGCGALRDLGDGICEIKRMYIRPPHRKNGLGRRILDELINRAKTIGYTTVRLDTLARLTPALALYESSGFLRIEPYNYNPEADIVYLEKPL